MVTKKTVYTAIALLSLLICGLIWINLDSDERKIKKTLQTITELAEKKQKEAALDSLQKAAKIGKFFHDPATLSLKDYNQSGLFSRKEITDKIIIVRARGQKISVSFHDTVIEVFEGEQASITTTMYAKGIENQSEKADIRELDLTMVKTDGTWLISKVTFVDVLKQ
jgi:hypothetical protein